MGFEANLVHFGWSMMMMFHLNLPLLSVCLKINNLKQLFESIGDIAIQKLANSMDIVANWSGHHGLRKWSWKLSCLLNTIIVIHQHVLSSLIIAWHGALVYWNLLQWQPASMVIIRKTVEKLNCKQSSSDKICLIMTYQRSSDINLSISSWFHVKLTLSSSPEDGGAPSIWQQVQDD